MPLLLTGRRFVTTIEQAGALALLMPPLEGGSRNSPDAPPAALRLPPQMTSAEVG